MNLSTCVSYKFTDTIDSSENNHFVYVNTDVVLLCFSINDRESFSNIEKIWMPEVSRHCPTGKHFNYHI